MTTYARYDTVADDLSVQTMPQNEFDLNCIFWEVPDGTDPNTLYVKGSEIKIFPDKPSDDKFWLFDKDSEIWIDPRSAEEKASDFETAKLQAIATINKSIGKIRAMFVTNIPFQDTTYQAKEKEAIAFLQDDDPDLVNYPYIANEIGITADTPYEIAQIYVNQAYLLHQRNSQLDGVRLGYVNQIELCANIDDIDPIMQSFNATIAVFTA